MTKARELAKLGEVMTNSQIGGRRNVILNPKMTIAQRGTSTTGVTSSAYIVDRFFVNMSSLGTWTISQSTTAPDGFSNSFKMDCTTADASPSSGDFLQFKHRIEAQDLQQLKYGTSSAETVTISFYVRSNKTGTYILEILQPDASNRLRSASYTINSADTWEQKVITFTGDTSGVINNDNGTGIELTWWLGAGSNFTSGTLQTDWGALDATTRAVGNVNLADSTSNEWYITGVQMEVGSYPNGTPFEHRSFNDELSLCQRYFQKSYNYGDAIGNTSNTNGSNVFQIDDGAIQRDGVRLTQTMRANPTIVIYNPVSGSSASVRTNAGGNHSVSTFSKGENGFFVDYTPNTGEFLQFHHTADAEL